MKLFSLILALSIVGLAVPAPAPADVSFGISVNFGPPALPVYYQPPCPQPDEIWQPGYWAWNGDEYYWVPGTWVEAPQPRYFWTPPYWAYNDGAYYYHPGYWGPHIGFYGGINYGFGYFGHGYDGGDWDGDHFRYNTAVTNVNTTVIKNVYVNNTYNNNNTYNTVNNTTNNNGTINNTRTVNRVSYAGGPGGVVATPTPAEKLALTEHHLPPTPIQLQHESLAKADRTNLASVNHGAPPKAAVVAPLATTRGGIPATKAATAGATASGVGAVHGPTTGAKSDLRGTAVSSPDPFARFNRTNNALPTGARTNDALPTGARTNDALPNGDRANRASQSSTVVPRTTTPLATPSGFSRFGDTPVRRAPRTTQVPRVTAPRRAYRPTTSDFGAEPAYRAPRAYRRPPGTRPRAQTPRPPHRPAERRRPEHEAPPHGYRFR